MNFLYVSLALFGAAGVVFFWPQIIYALEWICGLVSAIVGPFVKGIKMAWWLKKNDIGLLIAILSEKDPEKKGTLFDIAEQMYDNRNN